MLHVVLFIIIFSQPGSDFVHRPGGLPPAGPVHRVLGLPPDGPDVWPPALWLVPAPTLTFYFQHCLLTKTKS